MRRLAFAFAICATTLAFPRIADACSCIKPPSAVEAAAGAGAVFEAKFLSMETFDKTYGNQAQPFTQKMHRYTLKVSRVWKGGDIAAAGTSLRLITADNSAACGRAFEVGKSYLVYATHDGTEFSDGLCSRTMLAADAADDFAALGEATGDWKAPAGLDGAEGGAEGGDDGGPPTEPAVNPFERPPEDAPAKGDADAGEQPMPSEPPPAEASQRGCAIDSTGGGAAPGVLGMLFGVLWLRRRRRT